MRRPRTRHCALPSPLRLTSARPCFHGLVCSYPPTIIEVDQQALGDGKVSEHRTLSCPCGLCRNEFQSPERGALTFLFAASVVRLRSSRWIRPPVATGRAPLYAVRPSGWWRAASCSPRTRPTGPACAPRRDLSSSSTRPPWPKCPTAPSERFGSRSVGMRSAEASVLRSPARLGMSWQTRADCICLCVAVL